MRLPRVRELPIVFRCGALTALVPLLVKFLPLSRVFSILKQGDRPGDRSFDAGELAEIARVAVRFGPLFGAGECLVRSLVLYRLLRRSAYEPVLLIGGRLCDGQLDCHCWIEVDGKSLCEFNDPRETFKLLYECYE